MFFVACSFNFLRENHNDFWGPPKRQTSVVTVLFASAPKPRRAKEPKTPKNWKRNSVEPQRQHVAHALAKSNLHTNVANALQKLHNHRGFFWRGVGAAEKGKSRFII
ncbi:uncharacterized protein LOC117139890 [Drosophila mauritiana]|uniref:Uncharacterized protein LOC117139890 n=1 Tax=Drosophila mauritiana TaxID=7226 RepID=A0A6P8JQM5_DROMA|nr:uncharacterized protein LOC117139890 [Drosophila mauritiana]